MKERIVPMLFVLGAGFLLVLNSQGKLLNSKDANGNPMPSVTSVLFSPDGSSVPLIARASTFFFAFFVYLLVVSFLDETEAEWFTGVLALAALYQNVATQKDDSILSLFKNGLNASPIGAGN